MILFDPDQPEAANGFPQLAHASGTVRPPVPARPTLARYLREAQLAVGLKGEVSVLLTTDAGIRALNRRFRKKNKATDVLSFPVEAGFGLAGDLAISAETAARQAVEQGHRLSVELRVLMLHGLLHLAGFDHEADNGKMARKERRLRAKLGLPMGLIERVETPSGAKALRNSAGSMYGLKPVPFAEPKSARAGRVDAGEKRTSGPKGRSALATLTPGMNPRPTLKPKQGGGGAINGLKPYVERKYATAAKTRGAR
jgi:probable rRNA maturation factor